MTLSIRIDEGTKNKLDELSKRCRRSKSLLAAEAISAYLDSEESKLQDIQAGMADLEAGREVSHEKVAQWLLSWGKAGKSKAPR